VQVARDDKEIEGEMEVRKKGERGRREGKGKMGRPCRKDSIGRERSWSVSSEKNIEEYMKRKREKEEGVKGKRRMRFLRKVG